MNASLKKVITPSTEGLRTTLLETLGQFVNGEIDHIHAKTVAKMCDSINKSLSLDIEAARFIRESGNGSLAELNLNISLVRPVVERVDLGLQKIDKPGEDEDGKK